MRTLSNRDASLLRSQGGPLASVPFTIFPTDRTCRFDTQLFRILVLRRLRLPLPLTTRWCVCGRPLDNVGHHRAACSVAGILGRRVFPLETAAARIRRGWEAFLRRNSPVHLQLGVGEDSGHVRPARPGWTRRWSALLNCAAARAFASSL